MLNFVKKFASLVLAIVLVMGTMATASAASLSYADMLLGNQKRTVSQETAIRNGVKAMPDNVMQFLMVSGMTVDTVNNCPGAERSPTRAATTLGEKIFLYESSDEKNMTHEMGHVFSNLLGLNPKGMFVAYGKNLGGLVTAHGLEDEREFFADAFAFYILNKDGAREFMKKNAPALANLIEQIIAFDGNLFAEADLAKMNVFADTDNPAVVEAMLRGMVSPDENGNFNPNNVVTRIEGMEALYDLELHSAISVSYIPTDVDRNAEYAQIAAWAVQIGAVAKEQSKVFGADQTMTKQEVVKAMHAYASSHKDQSKGKAAELKAFSDYKEIGREYKSDYAWALNAGLLEGNTLDPNSAVTRAEMVNMLLSLIHYMEGLNA